MTIFGTHLALSVRFLPHCIFSPRPMTMKSKSKQFTDEAMCAYSKYLPESEASKWQTPLQQRQPFVLHVVSPSFRYLEDKQATQTSR